MELQFTVIICTRNRKTELRRALESLACQTSDRLWNVLVVDNGSQDGTFQMIECLRKTYPVPLQVSFETTPGLSIARNRGISDSTSSILLFVDDDVTFSAEWVDAHARTFEEDPKVVGTGGKILPIYPDNTPSFLSRLYDSDNGGPSGRYDFGDIPLEIYGHGEPWLPFGGNMGIRRDTALSLGGFREDLGLGTQYLVGEDTDFFRRIIEQNHKLLYVPDAKVFHHLDNSRISFRHYCLYYQHIGRNEILVSTPKNRLHLVRLFFRELDSFRRYLFRSLSTQTTIFSNIRKREISKGKLKDLLRVIFSLS